MAHAQSDFFDDWFKPHVLHVSHRQYVRILKQFAKRGIFVHNVYVKPYGYELHYRNHEKFYSLTTDGRGTPRGLSFPVCNANGHETLSGRSNPGVTTTGDNDNAKIEF